jgi:hypothetical protein
MPGNEEIWNKVRDFAALPPTPQTREALLATAPIHDIAGLLAHDSHADIVCRCLNKLVGGGEDEQGLQMLSSPQGQELLKAGLQHNNKVVRSMTISLIRGACSSQQGLEFVRQQGLLERIAAAVVDSELSVSSEASATLLHVVAQAHGGAEIVFQDCGKVLEGVLTNDQNQNAAELQLRVLELVARIWSSSDNAAKLCRETEAKRKLENFLDSDDVLLQLNAVEVLALLPPNDVEKLMPKLLATAEEVTGGAVPARLLECVARFVAESPHRMRDGDSDSDTISQRLCDLLHVRLQTARDDDLVDVVNAVASLCSTPQGMAALARSTHYPQIITCLPGSSQSLKESLRLASLCALGNALSSSADARSDNALNIQDNNDVHGGHLGRATTSLVNFLFRLAKSPIHEDRIAALHTLKGLCQHVWGTQAALCVDGFLEHVMDRSIETSKRAIEEKYEVARAISSHAAIKDVVGVERAALLAALVAQGPYGSRANGHVQEAIPIVATQRAS